MVLPRRFGASAVVATGRASGLWLAAVGVLSFSFTLPMTKVAVRGLDPLVAAIGRAAVASVLAAVVVLVTRTRRPSVSEVRQLVWVMAGVVVGFPLLTAYALRHTASLHGAVVVGLLPLVTAGLAVVRAGERPSMRYWACSVVGLAAVIVFVVSEGGGRLHVADLLLVLAVLAAGVGYTEGALLARRMGGWQVICWALILGAPATWVVTIAAAADTGLHASIGQWTAFGYTAVVSMFLGFFAWYTGMARAGIARASQLQLAQPALSMVWGWPLVGESLSTAAIVTVGVVLLTVAAGRRAVVH